MAISAFEKLAGGNGCQNLLYTLFELTTMIPLTVVCCSSGRADVLDLLEKRVKSRFSQIIIYFSHPSTFEAYTSCLKNSLLPAPADESTISLAYRDSVHALFSDQKLLTKLESFFEGDRDPTIPLTEVFLSPLISCTVDDPILRVAPSSDKPAPSSERCDRLPSLSLAEQCCLVAWKRTAEKCPEEFVSFDALYEEYARGFASSVKVPDAHLLASRFSRTLMRAAMDGLKSKGIIFQSPRNGPGESLETRVELLMRWPVSLLPDLLAYAGAPENLCKLAKEVL